MSERVDALEARVTALEARLRAQEQSEYYGEANTRLDAILGAGGTGEYLEMGEIATPASPAADKLRAYATDDGGTTKLAYLRSDGAEVLLDAAGLDDHNHTSGAGDGGVLSDDQHDGHSEYTAIAVPATPAADKARLFGQSLGNRSLLAYRDDSGRVHLMRAPHPAVAAPSPTAVDDEFEATSLDGKWTEYSSAAIVRYGSPPSHLMAYFNDYNQAYTLRQSYAPGDGNAFSLTLCARLGAMSSYQGAAIRLYNAAANAGVLVEYIYSSGFVARFQTLTGSTWTVRGTRTLGWASPVYLHLQRDTGNNWRSFISTDGYGWTWILPYAHTVSAAIMDIYVTQGTGGQNNPQWAGFDWIREGWATL